MNRQEHNWYHFSKNELLFALCPSTLALALAVMFSGNEDSVLSVLAHILIELLTLPGFVLLTVVRIETQHGNVHGSRWDLLSIPLSAALMLLLVKVISSIRDKGDAV